MIFENKLPEIGSDGKVDLKKLTDYLIELESRISESVNAVGNENFDKTVASKIKNSLTSSELNSAITPQSNEIVASMWTGIQDCNSRLDKLRVSGKDIKIISTNFIAPITSAVNVNLNLSSNTVIGFSGVARYSDGYSESLFAGNNCTNLYLEPITSNQYISKLNISTASSLDGFRIYISIFYIAN